MEQATLKGTVELPISSPTARKMRAALTLSVYDYVNDDTTIVNAYSRTRKTLRVPRQYGLSLLSTKSFAIDDCTTIGQELPEIPPARPRDYQVQFIDDIMRQFATEYDVVAQAGTGLGKTFCALDVARRLGRRALVVVDQNMIKTQWVERIKQFWGIDEEDIGLIQGSVVDCVGKHISVAMAQTLYSKTLPDEVMGQFGTVVFDEVHALGGAQYSKVLSMFPARYRLGISATPDRKDALQKLLDYSLGPVKVILDRGYDRSHVRYVTYDGVLSWYANISPKTGRYMTELSTDTKRNYLLANILQRLYNSGHHILAVSDRIEHLEELITICKQQGIPPDAMGLVAGFETSWRYAKNPTPKRKPEGLEKGAEYTPVSLQQVRKRIPKGVLEERKDNARIVFATYGMFNKAIDVPRLSAGIDCTPRSKSEQVRGRILRPFPGKLTPVWVTIRDVMSYRAEYQFGRRLEEYSKGNVEIYEWRLDKGIKQRQLRAVKEQAERNVGHLKRQRIITNVDGNNTVVTQSTERP